MDHTPNIYDAFFEKQPDLSTEESTTLEKLIATKKIIVRRNILNTEFQSTNILISEPILQDKTTAQSKGQFNNVPIKKALKEAPVKDSPNKGQQFHQVSSDKTLKKEKTTSSPLPQKRNKKIQKDKLLSKEQAVTKESIKEKSIPKKMPSIKAEQSIQTTSSKQPFGAYKKETTFLKEKSIPKKIPSIKAEQSIQTTSSKQPFGDYKKGTTFLMDKLFKDPKQQAIDPIQQATAPIKKEPVAVQEPTEQIKKMQPIDNHSSANTYGGSTKAGTHITDNPYVEKELSTEGKNLIPRSQEVHDILSYVPNWMIRWGNSVIFLILVGILVMSYYIKYPDVVKGTITINSAYPPVPLVSKAEGALTLLKQDKEMVYSEEVVGIIKNTANYQDVLIVKEELLSFQDKLEQGWNFSHYELPKGLQLGELQSAYSNLFIKLKEKKIQYQSSTNDKTRKQNLNQQLQELETIKKAKEKSLSIKYQEYLKAKNLVDTRYKALYKKGSISAEQLNAKESEVKNLLDRYQNDRMSFNEIKKRILDLSSSKVEIDFQEKDKQILSQSSLMTAFENLKSTILTWENSYLLKAPIDGTLNFVQYTKSNMYIKQAQTIANIIPSLAETDTSALMIGELVMPSIGAGKTSVGQVVNVALNDYPKKQYGIVEGEVESISDVSIPIPNGQGMAGYKVVVSFPKGLENTMRKEIQFKHNMQGNAEIITEDIRLIERFFHELRDIVGAN